MTSTNKYLWNYEILTYTNNTTSETDARVIGVYGDKGNTGSAGKGIKSVKEYYQVSTSNTTAPTTWSETIVSMTASNKYLWNYEVITYTDNTASETAKRVIGVYGDKGDTGSSGTNAYVHIRYSDDNLKFTGNSGQDLGAFIGICSTNSATAPTAFNSYKWSKLSDYAGLNKWRVDVYTKTLVSGNASVPTMSDLLANETFKTSFLIEDSQSTTWGYGDNFLAIVTTYAYFTEAYTMNTTAKSDDASSIYLNDTKIYDLASCQATSVTVNFVKGWNKIQFLMNEQAGDEYAYFSQKISELEKVKFMSAYEEDKTKVGEQGLKGDTGAAGKGISSTTVEYQKSTSGTTVPTGTWSTTIPAVAAKEYLWTRTTIKYTSGSDSVSYSVGMMGATGAAGSSAKLVSVAASSQVFKSTKGATGTFTPEYIYLYPRFQSVSYSKWQYSTNGTTWNNVTSGSNSLTIGTYNSVANSLRVGRNCNLYTKDITAVSFRCVSSDASIYDTTTVIKVYDVTDLQIGGRNLLLKSKTLTGTPSVTDTYVSGRGSFVKAVRSDGFTAIRIQHNSSWSGMQFIPNGLNLAVGEQINLSFSIQSVGYKSNISFYAMIFNSEGTRLQGAYLQFTYLGNTTIYDSVALQAVSQGDLKQYSLSITWLQKIQDVIDAGGSVWFSIQTHGATLDSANSYIDLYAPKVEKGNVATDWTPAPEDVEDSISGLNTYVDQVKDNLQNQIDGAIQFWNGENIPALSNYPANEWTTEELRINHQADIYTVIKDVSGELKQGKSYRFDKVNGAWKWIELTDNELSAVQALASSKAKVFTSTPKVPYNVGDLWLKDKTLWRCKVAKDASGSYALSDWEIATIYTDDSYAKQVQTNLDNLQIGGRNLLYSEHTANKKLTNDIFTFTRGGLLFNTNALFENRLYIGERTGDVSVPYIRENKKGVEITISFEHKLNNGGTSRPISVYGYQSTGLSIKEGLNFSPTTEWKRFSFKTHVYR